MNSAALWAHLTGGIALTVMTREQESLLDKLLELAGDATLLASVLRELNQKSSEPPTLREVIRRILERQQEAKSEQPEPVAEAMTD